MMLKVLRKYGVPLAAGLVLTAFAVRYAYKVRGYFAIGGEYLIPVLVVLVYKTIGDIITDIKN